jgi:hypothetical protein
MKRLAMILLVAIGAAVPALAHGKPEQVLGTVTTITDRAITVQTTGNKTRTIATNAKTMVMRGTEHLTMKDVKAGDRVVVEVDTEESVAQTIKVGATPAKAAPANTAPAKSGQQARKTGS